MISLTESIISTNDASIIDVAYEWLQKNWCSEFYPTLSVQRTSKGLIIDGELELDFLEPFPYYNVVKLIPGKNLKVSIGYKKSLDKKQWDEWNLSEMISDEKPFSLSLYSDIPSWLYELNLSRLIIGSNVDPYKLNTNKLGKNVILEFSVSAARNMLGKLLNHRIIVK